MRLAPLLLLLPALAGAQDVPSLQRPNPALPITTAIDVLRARLGKPGGSFAAAQLVLLGRAGESELGSAAKDADPLRRLDAAYGLGGADAYGSQLVLARLLGDPDPRVSGEAYTAFRRRGKTGLAALRWAAFHADDAAGDTAVELAAGFEGEGFVLDIVRTAGAAGRTRAVQYAPSTPTGLAAVEGAVGDPRPAVRAQAIGWILGRDALPGQSAAVERIRRSPSPEIRAALAMRIGGMYRTAHAGLLGALARDPSPPVRAATATAAGAWLYESAYRRLASTIVMRLVGDPDPAVADAAFEAAARYTVDQSYHEPWPTVGADARAASRRGLLRLMRGPKAFRAAVVLANLHDRRAYPVLAPIAYGRASGERSAAILALGEAGDRRATPHLLAIARGGDANDTNLVYAALGRLRDPASVAPLLAVVRREPAGWGTSAAAALGEIGDRSATRPLLAVAREVGPGLDGNYFLPLAHLGGPEVGAYLIDRLERGLETTADEAGRALIELRDPATLPDLTRIAAGTGVRAEEAKRVLAALRRS